MTKLELRKLLHKIAVSIRDVMQCDSVGVALPEAESGELRPNILDFPAHGKSIESGPVSDTTERVNLLGGHPKPAIGGHLKSGQRDS